MPLLLCYGREVTFFYRRDRTENLAHLSSMPSSGTNVGPRLGD